MISIEKSEGKFTGYLIVHDPVQAVDIDTVNTAISWTMSFKNLESIIIE